MPEIRILDGLNRTIPTSTRFRKFYRNVYSQGGEDGIIETLFDVMGERNRWCVEFGAWDGEYLSNSCHLIRDKGWKAVLIEGEEERCREIRANHPDPEQVYPMHRWVGFERGKNTIDDILAETPIPKDFDLISIDIDGIDWHVWNSIIEYRPRLVVIEYNPTVPNHVYFVQDRDAGLNEGNSVAALVELSRSKGYELVCVTNSNAYFVVEEEFAAFGIDDNSLEAMRPDRPGYIWQCYNGKIYHSMQRMSWWGKNVTMEPDSLQLLSEFWFHGSFQGRADDYQRRPASGEEDLETADGIVRELYHLHSNRPDKPDEAWRERNVRAWGAAKHWSSRHRGGRDAAAEPNEIVPVDAVDTDKPT